MDIDLSEFIVDDEEEVRQKEQIWDTMNADYLEKQELKRVQLEEAHQVHKAVCSHRNFRSYEQQAKRKERQNTKDLCRWASSRQPMPPEAAHMLHTIMKHKKATSDNLHSLCHSKHREWGMQLMQTQSSKYMNQHNTLRSYRIAICIILAFLDITC